MSIESFCPSQSCASHYTRDVENLRLVSGKGLQKESTSRSLRRASGSGMWDSHVGCDDKGEEDWVAERTEDPVVNPAVSKEPWVVNCAT